MIWALALAPILLGFWLYLLPRRAELLARGVGAATAAGGVFLACVCADRADESLPWFRHPFTANFHVGLGHGIAFWLVLLAYVTTACALLGVRVARQRDFTAQMLILLGSMIGVFIARDVLVFALFFDFMLIPVFLMLISWGPATNTAWRYLIYNLTGGLCLVLATAAYGVLQGTTDVIGQSVANGLPALHSVYAPWIFAGFALAFLIKTPVWPLHTWMPDTYMELAPPVAAVVSAVQSKAGMYGFLVIGMAIFPAVMQQAAPLMFALGLISLVYGACVALTQDDAKRIVAYSSLSHLGLIVLAIFSFNPIALAGAVVYMIAHGLFSAALFLVLAGVERRERTRSLSHLGGLGARNPRLAGGLLIAALAALGLPGLCGFAGELLILVGLYKAGFIWPAVIALAPIVLASGYMLRLFQGIMNGPEAGNVLELPRRSDLTWGEGLALAPLVIGMLLLGVDPGPLAHVESQLVRQIGLDRGCLPPNVSAEEAQMRLSAAEGLTQEQTADVLTSCYAFTTMGRITDFQAMRAEYLRGKQLVKEEAR